MSLWSRIANVFRADRLSREIDEEMQAHVAEAIENGRDPEEARRAFGSALRQREESRDVRVMVWLDSVRADAVFGWRQLRRKKVTSAAAILSLALAIGACTGAFRLIDALLLRPLPIAHAERLYGLPKQGTDFDGRIVRHNSWAYPSFKLMRAAVKDQAELIAISGAIRTDITFKSDAEMEKAAVQYVSGWMFDAFGLRPAAGRLLTGNDDREPGAHPYAVLSEDYWTRRFGRDRGAIGKTFRLGERSIEIVGVIDGPFTGTEPGTVADIFVPMMMNPRDLTRNDATWFRTFAMIAPGAALQRGSLETIRAKLDATSRAFERERAKGFGGMSPASIERFLAQTVELEPAAAGASGLQENYRKGLLALAILVAVVLLIACANVANLMTAQAAARGREMALRISIGAGRFRLVQLVLMESAMMALAAAAIGAWFAWWSAPFIVGMINPPDNPARLALPADWRVLGFGIGLTFLVTLLFGLAPALRASSVAPSSALKEGWEPHSKRRTMHALIAAQVAFCFLVMFVAGLFASTFENLSHRPLGFSPDGLLAIEAVTHTPQPAVYWTQVGDHLRELRGVESVAINEWAPLSGNGSFAFGWSNFVSINGAPPGPVAAWMLAVSAGWFDAMKMPFIAGRDFRATEMRPGGAIVNETFARQFLTGANPLGQTVGLPQMRCPVVGVVHDAPYKDIREPILPVLYLPIYSADDAGAARPMREATFMVRTAGSNPLAMAAMLRNEISRARGEFRVSNVRTQRELVDAQTVRERLLSMLALFFASVALLLAGVGLYGVLDYSVLQRRREIGIRIAIGARAGDIAWRVTAEVFSMVSLGAVAGLALGLGSVRYIETLLYGVNATDLDMLAVPAVTMVAVALLAAVPAVIRATRIDPVTMLRSE
jgi:putative ABC transport system permease protein